MAIFAAMVDRMDQAIGRIVTDLRMQGELDNTLIMFLSDNGACWEWDPLGFDESSSPKNILHIGADLKKMGGPGDYLSYGSAWANAGNTPFRLYKHFSHEGGIRTPFIAHWPAGVKTPGQLRTQAGHIIDIMPTLVELAGASYPASLHGVAIQPMAGRSLLPALTANLPLDRAVPLFFEHDGSRAVRDGDWKLVAVVGDAWELYNITRDPTEMKNLAAVQPERVKALAAAWHEWAKRSHVDVGRDPFTAVGPPGAKQKAKK
jgi:arylsulfatase